MNSIGEALTIFPLFAYIKQCSLNTGLNATLDLDTPHLPFDVFRPISVNVPALRKLKRNLQHCFIVLGEMADANNDEIFHKGKKIQEYSLAFKKEVIAYAEARGNQPASKQFSIVEKRV